MAVGRNLRVDSRRPLTYCPTVILVLFVALCLAKVWMMTSSTVPATELPFVDNLVDVTGDATRGDTNNNAHTDTDEFNEDHSKSGETTENLADKTQGENPVVVLKDGVNVKTEDGATDSDGGETNSGNQKNGQDKITEKNSAEAEHETNLDKNSNEIANNEQNRNSELNSPVTVGNVQQQPGSGKESGEEEKSNGDTVQEERGQGLIEKVEQNQDKEAKQKSGENQTGNQVKDQGSNEVFPDGEKSELLNETFTQNGSWSTQDAKSKNEKDAQSSSSSKGQIAEYSWKLCNVTAGADYIPCLDNEEAVRKLRSTKHYEHRERHCPEESPICLVHLPDKYRRPVEWPKSRDKVWYYNVPHTQLAFIKKNQNWVKVTGEYLTFPGGGTQFVHGALHYIDFIQEALPDIAWGKRSRVILDVGCGVASFGAYLFDRDVLTMSFAPKDEHEAQVQFALERGIPAISAVMGTKRLPFPGRVFDVIHCARCRVPWHIEGGMLLLELNRLLRPGGYFVWSATPVYRTRQEDVDIWKAMSALTKSMCWKLVMKKRDKLNQVGLAIYQKPSDNACYQKRTGNSPPLCQESDDPDAAWNISLLACMHRLPADRSVRGSQWPEQWPLRLQRTPYWLNNSQVGVYGNAAPEDFQADYEHWKHVVSKSYLNGIGIDWSTVRNVMDMRSVYGGFAAALRDMKVWVMNIVSIDSPDTLPIIYERGLFGMYHDWCESFSTYPRTYDLLHADHLFSNLKNRCKLLPVIAEVDRILRPEGKLIVRDNVETIGELESMAKSLHWEIRLTYSKDKEGLLCVQKTIWRPQNR